MYLSCLFQTSEVLILKGNTLKKVTMCLISITIGTRRDTNSIRIASNNIRTQFGFFFLYNILFREGVFGVFLLYCMKRLFAIVFIQFHLIGVIFNSLLILEVRTSQVRVRLFLFLFSLFFCW